MFAGFSPDSTTQFEVDEDDANGMIARGIKCVSEGANMPSTPEAIDVYNKNGVVDYVTGANRAGFIIMADATGV